MLNQLEIKSKADADVLLEVFRDKRNYYNCYIETQWQAQLLEDYIDAINEMYHNLPSQ